MQGEEAQKDTPPHFSLPSWQPSRAVAHPSCSRALHLESPSRPWDDLPAMHPSPGQAVACQHLATSCRHLSTVCFIIALRGWKPRTFPRCYLCPAVVLNSLLISIHPRRFPIYGLVRLMFMGMLSCWQTQRSTNCLLSYPVQELTVDLATPN